MVAYDKLRTFLSRGLGLIRFSYHTESINKRKHLDNLVRYRVEETLNEILDAEADAMCNAQRYERNPDRTDNRTGHHKHSYTPRRVR